MRCPLTAVAALLLASAGSTEAQIGGVRAGGGAPFGRLALTTTLAPAATEQLRAGAPRGLESPVLWSSTRPDLSAGLDGLFDGRGAAGSEPVSAAGRSKFPRGEWYASWGYPRSFFSRSDIRVIRPGLGDDFTFHGVKAHDEPEWDEGLLHKPLTVPEYNVRLGYFFNKKKDLALELNFDHVKYHVDHGQEVRMTGRLGGRPVDQRIELTEDVLDYELCDGANFLLLNVVKRLPLVGRPGETLSLAGLAKAGAGIVIPDPENTVFGLPNDHGLPGKHYKVSGWNTGLEAGLRFVPLKPFYLELADKLDYASYTGVQVAGGRAKQGFWTNEVMLSLGVTVDAGRKR